MLAIKKTMILITVLIILTWGLVSNNVYASTYYVHVGATGYTDTYNNVGFRSRIYTKLPQAMPENGWHYFWTGSDLYNDYFIQVGYVVSPTKPNGAWFWWAFDDEDNTINYKFGNDGSIGTDGASFYYATFMEGAPGYWGFKQGSTYLGHVNVLTATSGENIPGAVAELAVSAYPQGKDALGPVKFYPAIQYKPSSQYDIYYSTSHGYAYFGHVRLCPPYGVTGLGSNNIRAGSSQNCVAAGTKLW